MKQYASITICLLCWLTSILSINNQLFSADNRCLCNKSNLNIYLTNQSGIFDIIDITLYIDDNKILAQNINFVGDSLPAHMVYENCFCFNKGLHKLSIKTKKGNATLKKDFIISKEVFIVIAFWYDNDVKKGNFSIDILNKKPEFL